MAMLYGIFCDQQRKSGGHPCPPVEMLLAFLANKTSPFEIGEQGDNFIDWTPDEIAKFYHTSISIDQQIEMTVETRVTLAIHGLDNRLDGDTCSGRIGLAVKQIGVCG